MASSYRMYDRQRRDADASECNCHYSLWQASEALRQIRALPPLERSSDYEVQLAGCQFQVAWACQRLAEFCAGRNRVDWLACADRHLARAYSVYDRQEPPEFRQRRAECVALRALSKVRQGDTDGAVVDALAVLELVTRNWFRLASILDWLMHLAVGEIAMALMREYRTDLGASLLSQWATARLTNRQLAME